MFNIAVLYLISIFVCLIVCFQGSAQVYRPFATLFVLFIVEIVCVNTCFQNEMNKNVIHDEKENRFYIKLTEVIFKKAYEMFAVD